MIQKENAQMMQFATKSLGAAETMAIRYSSGSSLEEQFRAINQYAFSWMKKAYDTYVRKDYGEAFAKFINN